MNADQNLFLIRVRLCNPWLKVSLREVFDPFDSFLDPLHRRRIRDPNITFRSESRSICDDSVFLFKEFLCEVAGGLQILFQTTANVRERIERTFRLAGL